MTPPKQNISVLVVEDVEDAAVTVENALQTHEGKYQFDIKFAASIDEYLEQYEDVIFDVYVIDLGLDNQLSEDMPVHFTYAGNLVVEVASTEHQNSVVAVFSANKRTSDVCYAARLGAHIFVAKGEANSPEILVDEIVRELTEKEDQERLNLEIQEALDRNREILDEHKGKYVVLDKGEVIVSESTNLRALVSYRDIRSNDKSLPFFPAIIEVL